MRTSDLFRKVVSNMSLVGYEVLDGVKKKYLEKFASEQAIFQMHCDRITYNTKATFYYS